MRLLTALALVGAASAQKGFNYGSTFTTGAAKEQSDFQDEFARAQDLPGVSGFTSARLYTMVQGGTTNTPISAIPAAIDTSTTLLLGLWASEDQASFQNELDALTSAINQYGTSFTDLIVGISVGSEDLYRVSPTGIENDSGVGASPDQLVSYINQLRSTIAGTSASGKSVGHVDTWTAWVNGTNSAVIQAVDWLGMDAYPYFENTIANSIELGNSTFFDAYDNTVGVAQGKPVWITETGWPVSGPTENQAVASVANAQTYWDQTGCTLFDNIPTWWYILQDALPTTPSPSFGIIGAGDLSQAPLFDLTCPGSSSSSSSSAMSSATSVTSSAASPTMPSTTAASTTVSIVQSPGPETSPSSVTISQTSAPVSSTLAASSSAPASSTIESSETPSMTAITTTAVATSVQGTSTVYSTTLVTITSCASGCPTTMSTQASSAPASSAPASSAPASSAPASSAPAPSSSSCPANLNGAYEYPHLIIPVSSAHPSTAYGTSYNGVLNSTTSSIFNFDLPASSSGKTCSLIFLLPTPADLTTSSYTFNQQGGFSVNELSQAVSQSTSYDSLPAVAVQGLGSVESVKEGGSYVVASHACEAGSTKSFEFVATGGLELEFFQDYNASPIGAYVSVC